MTTRPRRRASSGWGAVEQARQRSRTSVVPGDVLACLDELGIHVYKIASKTDGDEAHSLCPGHLEFKGRADRHPSWSVNIETGIHSCWSCGFRGNFAHLVGYVLDLGPAEAQAWIRARGQIEYVRRRLAPRELPTRGDERPPITEAALALYTDPPISACADRLLHPDAVRELGILWDPAKELWITPIRDPHTRKLIGWQEKNSRWFRNRPKDAGKSRCLFGLDAFPGGQAVLVESPLDVARLRSVGITGGLSSYGVHVSAEQMGLVVERADELVLALDNDAEGRAETLRILEAHLGRIKMRVWAYGKTAVKDPGEQTADEIKASYRGAVPSVRARLALRKGETC